MLRRARGTRPRSGRGADRPDAPAPAIPSRSPFNPNPRHPPRPTTRPLPAGVGCVYSYDPVGNYERVRVSVTGSGESLIQPLLDNQLERQHQAMAPKPPPLSTDLPLQEGIDLVKDAFISAGERDIRTGDSVEICIIDKNGVRMEVHPLSKD